MDGKTDIQFGATRGIADNIKKYSQEEDAIFIGGSNYLVGDAISRFAYS